MSFLCLACGLSALTAARAQALFELRNLNADAGVDAPILDSQGSALWGGSWRVEVYGGPTPEAREPTVNPYRMQRREILPLWQPGYFRSAEVVTPLGVPNGGWAWLQVRVWSVTLGATYEEVAARNLGGYGESTVFYAKGASMDGIELPAPLLGLESFAVREIVPEPSAWVLMAAGVLSLCWLRRALK